MLYEIYVFNKLCLNAVNHLQFPSDSHSMRYDQESLDKIVLSDSDDAHSDDEAPITVRRAEDFDFEPEDVVPVKLTA